MNQEELNKILKEHELWLIDEEGGKRADLSNTDLSGVNLRDVNLRYANLSNTNLRDANLRYANLSNTDLSYTDLEYADLREADLRRARLIGANLKDIKTNIYTVGYTLACPETGSFIGYKKAGGCIVKLLILEDSKRSSATTAKCRCDKAKVLDIENIETGKKVNKVNSNHDSNFIYKLGEIVSVNNFDNNRWNECSTGIHFFINKENAINY